MQKKLVVIGALVCALSGFGIGIMEMPQEAEAALLPNPPSAVQVPAAEPIEPVEELKLYTEADEDMLARLIYTEARGVESRAEQAAVVWCVLNRLDNPDRLESSIAEVVTAPFQFDYRPWVPVTDEFRELAEDVLERWQREQNGEEDVGRVLPAEYQYFEGDGQRNYFTAEWKSRKYWGWELSSPYEDCEVIS